MSKTSLSAGRSQILSSGTTSAIWLHTEGSETTRENTFIELHGDMLHLSKEVISSTYRHTLQSVSLRQTRASFHRVKTWQHLPQTGDRKDQA